ncbi:MAG: excinuclease ABC subunit UvrB [Gammaproteobacteria bacterium]|nr:excinuclease ABC subunit UvrB [Gammaproteobacteria bacterium]
MSRKTVKTKKFELVSDYELAGDQPDAVDQAVAALERGDPIQTILGVTGSGKTFTMTNIVARTNRPALVIAPNKTLAAQLYAEFKSLFPQNAIECFVSYYDYYQPEAYVPSSDTFIEKDASINKQIEQMRLSATKAIMERSDTLIVATVSAIYGLGDPKEYMKVLVHINAGEFMELRDLTKALVGLQYQRNDVQLQRGAFRVRGEIVDIFPADSERDAIRVEFLDGEIERLQVIDPILNKTLQTIERFTIYPRTHYATDPSVIRRATTKIHQELLVRLAELSKEQNHIAFQRLEQRTLYDLEMLKETSYCQGIENYSRYLTGRAPGEPPPTLFDYFPKTGLLFLDESHVSVPQLGAMYKGDRSRKQTLVDHGFRLPSAMDNRPLKFAEIEEIMPQTICVSATPSEYELTRSIQVTELVARPTGLIDPLIEVRPATHQVDDLLAEVACVRKRGWRTLVTTLTKRSAEDINEYLLENNVKSAYLHSDIVTVERIEIIADLRAGKYDVLVGINLLREGLDIPETALVAIFDADKEGFLRSKTSLVQTTGRAARNVEGRVIFYADTVTRSMRAAIDETNRRREIQQGYNSRHGITPRTIVKRLSNIMDQEYRHRPRGHRDRSHDDTRLGAVEPDLSRLDERARWKLISELEQQMHEHAQALQFEEAAGLRDKIAGLRQSIAPWS